MKDTNIGRSNPPFTITNNPDTHNGLIRRHGTPARILESRKCSCINELGHPPISCKKCRGEGYIYNFQRKLLMADERNNFSYKEKGLIHPYMQPLMEPLKVETVMHQSQGGIQRYEIESFTDDSIKLKGNPDLPLQYFPVRLSYYFDRYDYLSGVTLIENSRISGVYKCSEVEIESNLEFSNINNIEGDIVKIDKLYTGNKEYKSYSFTKNRIYITEPITGPVQADLYYAKPARVLNSNLDHSEKDVQNIVKLPEGELNIGLESWWRVSTGDLITLLDIEYIENDIITHSGANDKLSQFDVSRLPEEIRSKNSTFIEGKDYILNGYRGIEWINRRPQKDEIYSVRYYYRPTYICIPNESTINKMDLKYFPQTVRMKLWRPLTGVDINLNEKEGYVDNVSDKHFSWPKY